VTPSEFFLLLVTVSIGTAGQFLLKLGASKLPGIEASGLLGKIVSVATIPEIITGLMCYGLGAVGYILLLSRIKLSIVGPSIALGYVLSVVVGHFAFREHIPFSRLVGVALIVCGVILVVWER
jgi:drug/metabolite transporter (DMT)-like permease